MGPAVSGEGVLDMAGAVCLVSLETCIPGLLEDLKRENIDLRTGLQLSRAQSRAMLVQ